MKTYGSKEDQTPISSTNFIILLVKLLCKAKQQLTTVIAQIIHLKCYDACNKVMIHRTLTTKCVDYV